MTAAAQTATTAETWLAWIAVIGGFLTAIVGILKYFNYRSRRDRIALVGEAFTQVIDALSSQDQLKKLAGAILLRRFFDRHSELGSPRTPYEKEAVGVIAALLRTGETGELQKLLADGLAYAPTLRGADLQQCRLNGAYLGKRPGRDVDLSTADLWKADLTGASLKGAKAQETVFKEATLKGTVFEDADVRNADFRKADLAGANFAGAQLAGARFDGAMNLPENISKLVLDDGTVPIPDDVLQHRWRRRWRKAPADAVPQ
jgi:hypothetical protein